MAKAKGEKKILAEGRFVRLVQEAEGWEYAERVGISGIVVLVPVTNDGKLVLTEQYRPPVKAPVLELPAGLAGDIAGEEDEPLERAARRELLEETGYAAERVTFLTEGPPSAGVQTEIVSFYLAEGLSREGPGGGDANEEIVMHEVLVDGAYQWLEAQAAKGVLVDPKIYAGLYFAQLALAKRP